MGLHNSSLTRVAPIFEALIENDRTGQNWLAGMLSSCKGGQTSFPAGDGLVLIANHAETWGENELSLPAPVTLLEHLIGAITEQQVRESKDRGKARQKREQLAKGDAVVRNDALKRLRAGSRTRGWHVLEGPSRPDATLELPRAIIVVEGKRTERSCTTSTQWMPMRSQLLRHMDAARDQYPEKRIFGMLLVEGDGGADATEPSAHWLAQLKAQVDPAMVDASMPHRSPEVRAEIANGVIGVTTWQAVCKVNGIAWPPHEVASVTSISQPTQTD